MEFKDESIPRLLRICEAQLDAVHGEGVSLRFDQSAAEIDALLDESPSAENSERLLELANQLGREVDVLLEESVKQQTGSAPVLTVEQRETMEQGIQQSLETLHTKGRNSHKLQPQSARRNHRKLV